MFPFNTQIYNALYIMALIFYFNLRSVITEDLLILQRKLYIKNTNNRSTCSKIWTPNGLMRDCKLRIS